MKNRQKQIDPDWMPEVVEKWSQALADEIDQSILGQLINNHEKEILEGQNGIHKTTDSRDNELL